jgi:CheY-like chemotaxis protein
VLDPRANLRRGQFDLKQQVVQYNVRHCAEPSAMELKAMCIKPCFSPHTAGTTLDPLKIAILEHDLDELDQALEMLSSSGHFCFGARSEEGLRQLLETVSVELLLLDWTEPDGGRYETLQYLAQHEPDTPIVLCVWPHTPDAIIDAGLSRGASLVIEKPFRSRSFDPLHMLSVTALLQRFPNSGNNNARPWSEQ